jgi:hypothetical protein
MRPLFLCVILFSTTRAFPQGSKIDTAFVAAATNYKISLFEKDIKEQSRLYNGTEYRDYLAREDEHPYYGVDDWSFGDIVYDDETYRHVPVFYDLSRDRLITEHAMSGSKIELIANKVSRFSIDEHQFVRLMRDEGKVIVEGFYEQLYAGKIAVYARREKILTERAESSRMTYSFEEKNRIYIYKDGVYHHVKSKGSVLKILREHQPELKAMLKKENIRFKSNKEQAIARMAKEYDQLIK